MNAEPVGHWLALDGLSPHDFDPTNRAGRNPALKTKTNHMLDRFLTFEDPDSSGAMGPGDIFRQYQVERKLGWTVRVAHLAPLLGESLSCIGFLPVDACHVERPGEDKIIYGIAKGERVSIGRYVRGTIFAKSTLTWLESPETGDVIRRIPARGDSGGLAVWDSGQSQRDLNAEGQRRLKYIEDRQAEFDRQRLAALTLSATWTYAEMKHREDWAWLPDLAKAACRESREWFALPPGPSAEPAQAIRPVAAH